MKTFPLVHLTLHVAALLSVLLPARAEIQSGQSALDTPQTRFASLAQSDEPSFRRHVVPLLSRTGCSGRECHGSFSGQGGFQLSLFGYDFDQDHKEITADLDDGVRIDSQNPEASLILLKPTMQEKHKGKERFKNGSWEYNLLLKWILAGAKNDAATIPDFDRLEVLPKEIVFRTAGEAVQLRILAHWKDGSVEDITQLTRFRTNDDSVAIVSDTGRVESKGKGDTHVVAFYDNGVQPIPVMLPLSDQTGSRYPQTVAHTKVDELVTTKLRKLGILPSDLCTDSEFLRRVSLDLTGTLPTPAEVEAFLADRSADKRTLKIDTLLASPSYAAWWTTKLCDFTGNNPRGLIKGGGMTRNLSAEMSRQWYDWIYRRVADNTPYDQLAAGIILATSRTSPEQSYKDFALEMGSYFRQEHPADFTARPNMPYYWQRQNVQKPEERALAFAHSFLGVRIECAQCHKHPFDQWTKTDFEKFQVFFAGVAYGPRPRPKDAPADEMTFQSLTQELRNAGSAGMMMMSPEPGGDSTPVKKVEPTKVDPAKVEPAKPGTPPEKVVLKKGGGGDPKAEQAESMRRLREGEPLPWPEVYVDIGRAFQGKPKEQRNKAQGGSRVLTPKLLGGEAVMLQQYSDPRQPLMDWLRDKDNPYFAKAFVNRVWASYFGHGIVEPADDLNLANAPSNGELIEYLSNGFVAHQYDMKWLHREILNSDTYQRSWKPNATNKDDEKNFSRATIRRLPAEVVLDAITMATASKEQAAEFVSDIEHRAIGPAGNAAIYNQSNGGKGNGGDGYTLAIFGKPARETNCDCERTADPTLLQTLFTRNDPALLQRLEGAKGNSTWIDELRGSSPRDKEKQRFGKVKGPLAPEEKQLTSVETAAPRVPLDVNATIREVFLRTVSRPPTPAEFEQAKTDIAAAQTPLDGIRDLLWAMLNTREFMVNH